MALLRRSLVLVGRLNRSSIGAICRPASGGGEGERVKGANYFNEGEDPVLKADTEVGSTLQQLPARTWAWPAHARRRTVTCDG